MKNPHLSNDQVSRLCLELSLLLHAGISVDDGLHLLLEDEQHDSDRTVLEHLSRQLDDGTPLHEAMKSTGAFPGYVSGLTEVGLRTGRLEKALASLAVYYDARGRLDSQLRSALLYPALLLLLMLVVVVVLLTEVLPVFDRVFRSLGGSMTGVAGGLLRLGEWLSAALPVLCVLLAVAGAFFMAFASSARVRLSVTGWWNRHCGARGVARKLADARFAQALAMGLQAGLQVEEALSLAASLISDTPSVQKRCGDCRSRMESGAGLAEALREAGLFPPAYCRMLALGVRSGSADTVMEEIARRMSDEGEERLASAVGRVEPTLTIAGALLVGVILLSVMLPLLNVLTAIG